MTMDNRRNRLRQLRLLLDGNAGFGDRYEEAKRVVRAFRRPAFYEISTRCNLFCEGCYHFSDDFAPPANEVNDRAAWEDFFAAESARGVTMAYFVGAEPALEQDRLIAAAPHFSYGNIGTNGIIRLDPAIPYRIGVSVWGVDEEVDTSLRGASAFGKALKNYAGDRRAIMLYTLSKANLADVPRLVETCADHGLPVTFNMYSPTHTYMRRLASDAANDREYFRISSANSNLLWDDESLAETRRVMDRAMERFSETVVYSPAYNRWATRNGPLYDIDPETGVATNCHSRMIGTMRYFKADMQHAAQEKCGTTDAICSECRMYSGGWSSKFELRDEDVADAAALADWLEMVATAGRIFLIEREDNGSQRQRDRIDLQASAMEPAE